MINLYGVYDDGRRELLANKLILDDFSQGDSIGTKHEKLPSDLIESEGATVEDKVYEVHSIYEELGTIGPCLISDEDTKFYIERLCVYREKMLRLIQYFGFKEIECELNKFLFKK